MTLPRFTLITETSVPRSRQRRIEQVVVVGSEVDHVVHRSDRRHLPGTGADVGPVIGRHHHRLGVEEEVGGGGEDSVKPPTGCPVES